MSVYIRHLEKAGSKANLDTRQVDMDAIHYDLWLESLTPLQRIFIRQEAGNGAYYGPENPPPSFE